MYVVVEHEITDSETFFGKAGSVVENVTEGVKTVQFFPNPDKTRAICLWEAPTVEAVEEYLESPVIGESAKNIYYPVDTEVAMGLPVTV